MLPQFIKKIVSKLLIIIDRYLFCPFFSKIFEKIVSQKLYNHLVTNNLITTNQSGFRPNDTATNQLIVRSF